MHEATFADQACTSTNLFRIQNNKKKKKNLPSNQSSARGILQVSPLPKNRAAPQNQTLPDLPPSIPLKGFDVVRKFDDT